MPPSREASAPKDQYQHYVPRFILRRFQADQAQLQKNKKQRQKDFNKARKTGIDPESVMFYDMASATLERRSVGKVYGAINLYQDAGAVDNVNHLEEKFSRLENDAAMLISNIHKALDEGQITIKRRQLETIRKFLYLMHYRNAAVSSTYFQEDHPENFPMMEWIRQYKKVKKLTSDVDVWLSCLEYYLETPHYAIVTTAEGIRNQYGDAKFLNMFLSKVDPKCEYWHAVDYETLANVFFLGIWEAADDEEFILSNNAFGIWEGTMNGMPAIHRLYVVSPRILLVLKSNFTDVLTQVTPGGVIHSSLANIPTTRPIPKIAHMEIFAGIPENDKQALATALQKYRATDAAQDDTFKFRITKLTARQTISVNEVLALNTRIEGSITFSSTDAMLRSMNSFMSSTDPFVKGVHRFFKPLIRQLSPGIEEVEEERVFGIVFQAIVSGGREFKSTYDRAYFTFKMTSSSYHSMACDIQRGTALAISKMTKRMKHKAPNFAGRVLSDTLPQPESELFFAIVGFLVTELEIRKMDNTRLEAVKHEAIAVGLAEWLAENHVNLLESFLEPWMDVFKKV